METRKAAAAFALGEERKMVRWAAHVVRDRERLKGGDSTEGNSAFSFKGGTPQEVEAIQSRSAIRGERVGA